MNPIFFQRQLIILFFIVASLSSAAQPGIRFIPSYQEQSMNTGAFYPYGTSDSISIETFKLYISQINFLYNDSVVLHEENSFHLLDLGNPSSFFLPVAFPENLSFNQIRFNIGIDSVTNVSGVMGGDLDPTKGMYWTWQSGYINFKLEGVSNLCTTRHNRFQFHLGGYQSPYNSIQTVTLNCNGEKDILIHILLDQFLESIDLSQTAEIMSPNEKAMTVSRLLATIFSFAE